MKEKENKEKRKKIEGIRGRSRQVWRRSGKDLQNLENIKK